MGDRKTIAKAARSVRILLVMLNFWQLPNSKGPGSKWVLMKTQEDAGPCGWMQGSVPYGHSCQVCCGLKALIGLAVEFGQDSSDL